MKSIWLLLCMFLSFSAVAKEIRVLKGPEGYVLEETSVLQDTGIKVDGDLKALGLTREQLASLIDKNEPVLLNVQQRNARWSKYLTHIEYDAVSTEQVVRDGMTIRKVSRTVVTERKEFFNPFFICALIYTLCMFFVYRFYKSNVAFAAAVVAFAAAVVAAGVAVVAVAAAVVAAAVVVAVGDRSDALVGIVLMCVSSVLMYVAV